MNGETDPTDEDDAAATERSGKTGRDPASATDRKRGVSEPAETTPSTLPIDASEFDVPASDPKTRTGEQSEANARPLLDIGGQSESASGVDTAGADAWTDRSAATSADPAESLADGPIADALDSDTSPAADRSPADPGTPAKRSARSPDPPGLISRLAGALGRATRPVDPNPYDPEAHGPLATYEVPDDREELDRYWVAFPAVLVVIVADPETDDRVYRVVEPDCGPVERELLSVLEDDVRDPLLYRDESDGEDTETLLRTELATRLAEYDLTISPKRFETLYYYLDRSFQGYGRLNPLMHDPHIEDISCDGYDLPLFVYHDTYENIETTVSFDRDVLDDVVVRLAQRSGQHISLGQPVIEATLPDGSRAELALGTEITPRGSAFTIRQYAEDPFTPLDLIERGTFSTEQIAYLWLCIEHDRSLLFAGGTASGKTTAMNAVSMFIPPRAKVLSIEDTRELALYHDNWLSSITRERSGEQADLTMYDLLRSALRHRPEYIIVGEVRGEEAMTLFQAMNTGHTTYSTMHADSVRTAINRLENDPISVPRQMVQSLDVLCVQGFGNVEGERVRRNIELAEIDGIDERTGELDYSTAFEWDPASDVHADRGSTVTETIREGQGWSRTDLLRELKRRRTYLETLREQDVTDYRRFTAAVQAYYTDPERAISRLDGDDPPDPVSSNRSAVDSSGSEPQPGPEP